MDSAIRSLRDHRSSIMGLAIVWVVFYHSGLAPSLPDPFRFLAQTGYGGVDLFLFLSGFGLYHSLERDPQEGRFWLRRAQRLYPAYIPVLLVWAVKTTGRGAGLHHWLRLLSGNLTGAAFWIQMKTFNWYILALPVFYLATPLLKRTLDGGGRRRCLWLLAGCFFLSMAFWDEFSLVAVSRFPIFILGMYLAKMEVSGETVNRPLSYGIAVLGMGLLWFCLRRLTAYLWDYGLWWYPFLLLTPGLVFFLGRLCSWAASSRVGAGLVALFRRLGEASLEIYLIHVPAFEYLEQKLQMTHRQRVAAMAVCVAAGLVYHWVIESGRTFFRNSKQANPQIAKIKR